jgi:sulfite reductase (ferredoxin)
MTEAPTRPRPATPAPATPRTPRRTKGEGQWKLGYREPLNANEQAKKDDDALNVRARIENIYAHTGFERIDPVDLRNRFRWWGLYTQRKQGIDGGRTATLAPEALEDSHFMLRVRIDGGQLDLDQLRAIADVSTTYGRDTADLTDRQNIQLHWVRVEDVPAIWQRLESAGLTTAEACGDCPRVILGSPVAGIAADEVIDGTAAIREIERRYVGDQRFSNLPRKFKTAVSGSPSFDTVPEINDVSFVGVVHPEHGPGFDVWVGGGLSTNPMLAQRLGAWVAEEDVPDVWEAVVSVFRDYGYRRLRARARLKFLVADWGIEKFRQVMEDEYLGRKLLDGPAPERPAVLGDHVGVHRQADGRFYVGVAPSVGRVSGSLLGKVADVVEAHGSTRVRTTAQQKLLVLDVEEAQVEPLVAALAELGLHARPSAWRRNTMACTGLEFCKLAIVDTKNRAQWLVSELERRIPDLDVPITVNVNGCPNACARTQVGDIGLKGMSILHEGQQVEGFQVHLGGAMGLEAGFGRKLRAHKVAAVELADYVERVVRHFLAGRVDGESFATWVQRADDELLR